MMAVTPFKFAGIRNTAQTLVKKFGRPCVLLRATEATPADATKPWRVGDGTTTSFPFIGVVSALGFPKKADPIVDATDADVIMPGDAGVEPVLTDRVQILGLWAGVTDGVFAIIGVKTINPDGTVIMHTLRVRAWPAITMQPAAGL
jgi:hypothetical protein